MNVSFIKSPVSTLVLSAVMLLVPPMFVSCKSGTGAGGPAPEIDAASVEFVGDSALALVREQCSFGPRVPGSEASSRCGDWIVRSFTDLGLDVSEQKTTVKGWDGKSLPCRNIMARWKPEMQRRVVVFTHWDSRPWADQDPDSTHHRQPVMAANDGASGVAVMLEVARLLDKLNPNVGVDFVCFDVEDYGAPYWSGKSSEEDGWCLGSQYWATHLPADYVKPEYGILLDMVGGMGTHFRYEYNSRRYAEAVVARVWAAAKNAGAEDYFLDADGLATIDDHVPVNKEAGIPTIDIIGDSGNGFPLTWHTVSDTPENISPDVLKAVGQTLLQLLYEEE